MKFITRNLNKIRRSSNSGFTLLEMIVSLGIFSVVAVIAIGSLVRITSLNRQAQTMQTAMNNINFILEAITREMRFGSHFNCQNAASYPGNRDLPASECDGNGNGNGNNEKAIMFRSARVAWDETTGTYCPLIYAYWFKGTNIGGSVYNWSISKSQQTECDQPISLNSGSVPLVDTNNVKITTAVFSIKKDDGGPGLDLYSWASIRLAGYVGDKETEKNYFDVRTGVSQRILDI
jgi:prepilin-type N-terminal cleavage/methylation domain-containing protein